MQISRLLLVQYCCSEHVRRASLNHGLQHPKKKHGGLWINDVAEGFPLISTTLNSSLTWNEGMVHERAWIFPHQNTATVAGNRTRNLALGCTTSLLGHRGKFQETVAFLEYLENNANYGTDKRRLKATPPRWTHNQALFDATSTHILTTSHPRDHLTYDTFTCLRLFFFF